jgi:hypothetical protein
VERGERLGNLWGERACVGPQGAGGRARWRDSTELTGTAYRGVRRRPGIRGDYVLHIILGMF